MSYEGHTKILCEQGHLYVYDAYDAYDMPMLSWKCPTCKSRKAWSTNVDETNGEDETGLCPGDVKLRIRNSHKCKCKCGHVHAKERVQYFIPKQKL
jgi:hypothetical protein